MKNAIEVRFERGEDGWWLARIPSVQGVHSNGRSLDEARRRIRQALALAEEEGWNRKAAASVELVESIELSAAARTAIASRRRALETLQDVAETVERTTESAIRELADGMGLGLRDVAALLDLSHQRVHQIANSRAGDGSSFVAEPAARYRRRFDRRAAARRRRP